MQMINLHSARDGYARFAYYLRSVHMDIDQLKSLKKIIGTKQTQKGISRGEVTYVFLAHDGDERMTMPVRALCEEYNIPLNDQHTMDALGRACRIKVKATAVSVLR